MLPHEQKQVVWQTKFIGSPAALPIQHVTETTGGEPTDHEEMARARQAAATPDPIFDPHEER